MGAFAALCLLAYAALWLIIRRKGFSLGAPRFADYVPYAFFLNARTVITKDGRLLAACRIVPHDLDYVSDDEVEERLAQLNKALGELGGGWTCYADIFRRRKDSPSFAAKDDCLNAVRDFERERLAQIGECFWNEAYAVLCWQLPAGRKLNNFLLAGGTGGPLAREIALFNETCAAVWSRFADAFKAVLPLGKDEMCAYLHLASSAREQPVKAPKSGLPLDVYLADGRFHADVISKIDDTYVLTAGLQDFPEATDWRTVSQLFRLNLEFRLQARFCFVEREKAKALIKSHQRALFAKVKGLREHILESVTHEASQVADTEAEALADEAGEAIASLADGQTGFGYLTPTILVTDKSYANGRERLQQIIGEFNKQGFIAKEESLNSPLAVLGAIPGNTGFNSRRFFVSTHNFAHFFPLSSPWEGYETNAHLKEISGGQAAWPHLRAASGGSLFNLNLNVGDVGHTLVLGPTGAGKSVLLGCLAYGWLTYPKARVVFFDKDKSSRPACLNAEGKFYDLGAPDSPLRLNPFSLIESPENRGWLADYLAGFLDQKIGNTDVERDKAVRAALESMAAAPENTRGFELFCAACTDSAAKSAFEAFAKDSAFIFADGPDNLESASAFQVFEMNELMQRGKELAGFALGYLFRRLQQSFDGRPTLLVLDEAWLFLDSPYFARAIRDWLKTLRKKNVYVVMATQELADAAGSPIFSAIASACETKILLPNRQAGAQSNYELYLQLGLGNEDIGKIAAGQKKRDYYYFSQLGAQQFQLCLSPKNLKTLKEVS